MIRVHFSFVYDTWYAFVPVVLFVWMLTQAARDVCDVPICSRGVGQCA